MRWDKRAAQIFARSGMLSALERWEQRRGNVLRILAYHRIGFPEAEVDSADPALFSATPEQFEEQMQLLAEQYCVVSVEDVLSAIQQQHDLSPRSVLITFDDAYQDFKTYAWPVLRCLQLPAVLFVPTDYVSGKQKVFWWDRLYRAIAQTDRDVLDLGRAGQWSLSTHEEKQKSFAEFKRLFQSRSRREATDLLEAAIVQLGVPEQTDPACLSWQEIREMVAEGLMIGAHTKSHPLLSRISIDEARHEISGSHHDIQEHVGRTWPIFAYPSGHPADLHAGLTELLEPEGIHMAVTMIEGHNKLGKTSPLLLRRVGMAPHLSVDDFRLALTGIYNLYGMMIRLRAANNLG